MTVTSPSDTQAAVDETGTHHLRIRVPSHLPLRSWGAGSGPRPASCSFPRGKIVVLSGLLGADSLSGGYS